MMDQKYEIVRRIMLATNKIDGVYYLFGKNAALTKIPLHFFMRSPTENHIHKKKLVMNG